MLIDTHAHLNFPDFEKDLDQVIKGSLEKGVSQIICVSSNLQDSEKTIALTQKYPKIVFATVGIHPHQTDPENNLNISRQLQSLEKLAQKRGVVAIGECGLDFTPAPPGEKDRPEKKQIFLFEKQITLAKKLKLPIIVHCRKAFPLAVAILKTSQVKKGVFHCYSTGKKGLDQVFSLGFYFGVDGNLTYDEGLQNVYKAIPLERIILETDAPFLSPEPYRGLRNEPANIKVIAKFLAGIKDTRFETLAEITTKNAQKLFSLTGKGAEPDSLIPKA